MGASSGFVPVLHAATVERPDEVDTLAAADAVSAAVSRLGYSTEIIALDFDLSVLDQLAARKPVAVFNLVEAMRGDDRLIAIVPMVLEHLRVPYTGGAAAAFLATLSKVRTKQMLELAGLPTPDWSLDGAECDPAAKYIVKADTQHGSLGMDAGSIVHGAACANEIAERSGRFATQFFAERFVEGREFNVALVGTRTGVRLLPIQEIVFEGFGDDQPRIVDYAAKWDPEATVYHTTPRRFGIEQTEPDLAARLEIIAREAWQALGLTGYARVDFRVDGNGLPYILEVNINPAITPDAGLPAAAAVAKIEYDALVGLIVDEAVNRA